MNNKIWILIVFTFYFNNVYSQYEETVGTVFKTLLILDGCIKQDKEEPVLLHKSIRVEIDELFSKKVDTIYYPLFFTNYKVFSFTIGKNKIHTNDESIYFNSSTCKQFIIIFNTSNNKFYRLKGFRANDFYFLLKDIISDEEKIKERDIVKELDYLEIGNLDFKCLYKAINDSPRNINKYSCMSVCTDAKPSHSRSVPN